MEFQKQTLEVLENTESPLKKDLINLVSNLKSIPLFMLDQTEGLLKNAMKTYNDNVMCRLIDGNVLFQEITNGKLIFRNSKMEILHEFNLEQC